MSRKVRFRLIEHTADTGLVAYGENLSAAFANAAYGLFSIITDLRKIKETEARTVEINEGSYEALLFEWLNYLIYLFDTEMLLFERFDIVEFSEYHLKAICSGEKYDQSRHRLKTGVKAATYHQLTVDKKKNQVQVIFDI